MSVQVPKVRDRSGAGIKFTSAILPPYLRRAQSVEEVLPWLYLKGISTGDMQEALEALLGPEAKGLSPASISRLKARWEDDHQAWSGRDLSDKRYVYFWIDGVYFNVRMDEAKQCILVIIGVTEDGVKEFVAIDDGYRESEQSWLMALRDLKQRGLQIGPELAVGDGALGFWKALPKVYGQTRSQRCWVHKTKKRAQLPAQGPPGQGQSCPSTDMDGAESGAGSQSFRSLRDDVSGQVSQGRRVPSERPRSAAGLL